MIQFTQFIFFAFVIFGVGVIAWTRNVIHAAYALALVLLSLAGMYVFLNAEVLAVVQILLYAGGVIILLIFGVMMTNRKHGSKPLSESRNSFLALVLSVGIFVGLLYLFSFISLQNKVASDTSQVKDIGTSFLTDHVVAFELIAFVLLVALVGASYIAKMSSND